MEKIHGAKGPLNDEAWEVIQSVIRRGMETEDVLRDEVCTVVGLTAPNESRALQMAFEAGRWTGYNQAVEERDEHIA